MSRALDELKSSLRRGVIGFGVTPFRGDLSVNIEALNRAEEISLKISSALRLAKEHPLCQRLKVFPARAG